MAKRLIQTSNLKMIEGDDKVRSQRCLQNVQVILEQYDCELHPLVTITPMGNEFGFKVVPKPRGKPN